MTELRGKHLQVLIFGLRKQGLWVNLKEEHFLQGALSPLRQVWDMDVKEQKWVVIAAAAVAVCLAFIAIYFYRNRRGRLDDIDGMEGHDFEYFCAELLKKRGFEEVSVTKGSGDYGVDILAEKDGITYAIQCKCHSDAVGIKAVQEVYAGRDYYDCMVGAVLTNQYFTSAAVNAAKKLKILLWDRGYLDSMMEEE